MPFLTQDRRTESEEVKIEYVRDEIVTITRLIDTTEDMLARIELRKYLNKLTNAHIEMIKGHVTKEKGVPPFPMPRAPID